MRLSPTTGKLLGGQGGGTISVDGVVPASLVGHAGGGWGWLDDTTCAGQADIGGYLLRQLVLPNTLTVLDSTATGTTDAAQNFRAGNSEWAAWMSGGALKGTRSATVTFTGGTTVGTCSVLPLTGLGDIDDTGRIYLIQNFAGDAGIAAYATSGGRLWTSNTSVLDGNNRLRAKNGSVAYQDTTSAWHLLSATTGLTQSFAPRTDEVVAATVPVTISGATWVVELTGTKLTIRPSTSSNGYILSTSANLFNPDAVSLSAGTVRVGWSVTTGENPTDLRIADLTIATGALSTGTTASGSLVITPQSPATPSALPVGPVEGGSTSATKQPRKAMKEDGSGFVGAAGARQYQAWWDTLAGQAAGAIPAGRIVPPVPPPPMPSFGTIDVAGQSPVVALVSGDAVEFIAGANMTLTTNAGAQSVTFASSGSGGGCYIPLVDGSEPPNFITDGSGVLILVAYP